MHNWPKSLQIGWIDFFFRDLVGSFIHTKCIHLSFVCASCVGTNWTSYTSNISRISSVQCGSDGRWIPKCITFSLWPEQCGTQWGALLVHPIYSEWRGGCCSSMTSYLMVCCCHWSHQSERIKPGLYQYKSWMELNTHTYSAHKQRHTHTHTCNIACPSEKHSKAY